MWLFSKPFEAMRLTGNDYRADALMPKEALPLASD
jgi:hypothetical protein